MLRSARGPGVGGAAALAVALLAPAASLAQETAPVTSAATDLPTDPVLEKLIEESLAARPEIARAQAEVRARRERVPQAGALPDPMLQVGIQNDSLTSIEIGELEGSFLQIMGSQTLPWPGKRRLREQAAELEAARAEPDVARARLTTEAEVRRAYLDLALARERLELLGRLESIWQRSQAAARARYEAGQGAQSDVLRAQLELQRIKQRRRGLEAEAAARVQALNRLRGRPLDEPVEPATKLADLPEPGLPDEQAAVDDALARSPELAAARLGVEASEKSVALAQRDYYPDLTVNAGIMPRPGLGMGTMWLLNVGGPLPIFQGRKQDRAVAEGKERRAAAQADATALEQTLRLRVKERRTALEALLDVLRIYRQGLLVQSEATAESTLAQFATGRTSFASVLEANAGFVADQDGFLQALADAWRIPIAAAEASLEATGGVGGGALGGTTMPGAGAMTSGNTGGSGSGAARSSGGAATAPASGAMPAGM